MQEFFSRINQPSSPAAMLPGRKCLPERGGSLRAGKMPPQGRQVPPDKEEGTAEGPEVALPRRRGARAFRTGREQAPLAGMRRTWL